MAGPQKPKPSPKGRQAPATDEGYVAPTVFARSAPTLEAAPPADRPEVAFIGRSNVGKSSLINMLARRKGLALTSGTPGKTRLINFFDHGPGQTYWVDLPGYGYARVGKAARETFMGMIAEYLTGRQTLRQIFVLIDIRHPVQASDREFLEFVHQERLPYTIVFTKADKLSPTRARLQAEGYLNALLEWLPGLPEFVLTSSETGLGRNDLLALVASHSAPPTH